MATFPQTQPCRISALVVFYLLLLAATTATTAMTSSTGGGGGGRHAMARASKRINSDGAQMTNSRQRRQLVIDPPTAACRPCTQEGVRWCVQCSMAHKVHCTDEFPVPCELAIGNGKPGLEDGWCTSRA
ncbi:hypothetical protein MAPG_06508 [Magnaporthiopsis poae ATCC 64411]|uniref:Uncharacterized protein n=1 Tax=Magnaporthiopsis poae (strain ATCC 64411 / 73-15) TaxID=644358 RepID=A0A0C4E279_MAGP6|nr:hypothetical protein MAPG_06508 [Magnaporthiopsis poae ATCC 64411]